MICVLKFAHNTTYSSYCLQIILVYLHPSRHNSLFLQLQIAKKLTKTPDVSV